MTREVSQRQLRNESGKIIRGLEAGESFVVTRNGVPVGELTPLRRRRFVPMDTVLAVFKGAAPVDYSRLQRDLDAVADQDPELRV